MATVVDPICGMHIDADDAVASATIDGETHSFCSEACRAAFVSTPEVAPDRLSADDLARRSGTTLERIEHLAALGIVEPDERGTFPRRDVMRARTVAYLAGIGIATEDLAKALASGHLRLGYLESAGRVHPRTDATYAERSEAIGLPFSSLQRLYVAFGLRSPTADEHVREEDRAILEVLPVLFGAGVAEEDVLRMARVWGDSARRIAQYLPHYFHTAVEEPFRRRGLGDNQAFEAALVEVGVRVGRGGEDLLGWLFRRHTEAFQTAHQVDHVETALEEAGLRRRRAREPEAAVFADLSGFTRLTEQEGDEAAADVSLEFAHLVGELAARHDGTIVKLLGDGVLLHFRDPAAAVRAALALVDAAPAQGLPPVHAGIEAGPILYDEGDYFGRTVNVAARIAAQASANQVFVGAAVPPLVAADDGIGFRDLGRFELKGIAEPMTLYEASRQP
jgi:adenylate cyclase